MKKRFKEPLMKILHTEGGFTSDEADPGHRYRIENGDLYDSFCTNRGITQYSYSLYKRRQATRKEMVDMTQDQALDVYLTNYILKPKLDKIDEAIFPQLLDMAINHGAGQAIKWLQKICNVGRPDKQIAVDGSLGPITIKAFNDIVKEEGADNINNILVDLRLSFYERLMARKPELQKYRKGWIKRALEYKA